MITWMSKITISEGVASKISAGETESPCTFTYTNTKNYKETSRYGISIERAIHLAETRREDGRYRNFEFTITL